MTVSVPIALAVDLIDIQWSVVPVPFEDRYEVVATQKFETKVPAAVIVLEPAALSVPALAPGEVYNTEVKITNYGLIEAFDIQVELPESVGNGEYVIEVMREAVPAKLGAMQSATIPVRVSRSDEKGRPRRYH